MNLHQRGFGMIEVMVAAAMLGVVSLGVMKLLETQSKGVKNAAQSAEISNLHNEIIAFLSQEEVATFNFVGLDPASVNNVADLKNIDSSVKYQNGQEYGSPKVKIVGMKIGGSFEQIGADANFGRTPFVITYEKSQIGGTARTLEKSFNVTIRLNAGVIETAQSSASSGGAGGGFWASNPTGIHYSDGYVGIGTSTPDEALQVEGWIKAKTGHNRYIEIGGDSASDDYELRTDSAQPITIWNKADGETGSMIMRSLKLTSLANAHGAGCGASQEGEVRYNNTSKTLETCNGGSFITVGPFINRCTWRHDKKAASDYYNLVNCAAGEVVISGSCYLTTGSGSSIYASVALTNMGHRCGAAGAMGTCSRWWCGVSPNAADIEVNALCCSFNN